jgi:hypothetical protein
MLSSLVFLFSLNQVLQRLTAMLPDETLRAEKNSLRISTLSLHGQRRVAGRLCHPIQINFCPLFNRPQRGPGCYPPLVALVLILSDGYDDDAHLEN